MLKLWAVWNYLLNDLVYSYLIAYNIFIFIYLLNIYILEPYTQHWMLLKSIRQFDMVPFLFRLTILYSVYIITLMGNLHVGGHSERGTFKS